jgi:hypothetical protein
MPSRFALLISVSALFAAVAFGQTTQPASTQPASIPTSATTRVPHKVPPAGTTLDISIKELGNFDYNQVSGGNIPADVKALSGSKLRLRGYMIPMDGADDTTQFALVTKLGPGEFPPFPSIQNIVVVDCPKGKAVTYYPEEIVVEGTLSVGEKKVDGVVTSIFEVACTSVRPVPK